jgi:exodeoxyribonuclease VIII
MNDQEYFALDAINATLLKDIIKQSPVHAQARRARKDEPTHQMKLGTAVHTAILDLNVWGDTIAVAPAVDRRTKAGKAEYSEFLETVDNKTIITADQFNLVEQMKVAVFDHPEARRLLANCTASEHVRVFEYEGEQCKAKIDAVDLLNDTIIDIKTTADASPQAFAKQSANYLYHMQLAWYARSVDREFWSDALIASSDVDAYIIAIENTPPHAVVVYIFDAEALRVGWHLCKRAVREWKEYKLDRKLNDKSFAYGSDIHDLCLPAWADQG